MARLHRPYIPLSVRVQVAERQVRETKIGFWAAYSDGVASAERLCAPWTLTRRLRVLLKELFPFDNYQLDHDPALQQRKVERWRFTVRYIPDANDPAHLVYRTKELHLQKTTGRKPGAERTVTSKGSDVWIAQKFRKLEGKNKPRRKVKIPSRPFQKGKRKINVRR